MPNVNNLLYVCTRSRHFYIIPPMIVRDSGCEKLEMPKMKENYRSIRRPCHNFFLVLDRLWHFVPITRLLGPKLLSLTLGLDVV